MLAIHFGAGNIGRGFIGLLLHKAGYKVCFVDVNSEIIDEINRRQEYTVRLASEEQTEFPVNNVMALNSKEEEKVAEAIANADLVTTAVGPNILKFVAPVIAKGIAKRLNISDKPLNVVACENMIGGSSALQSFVNQHLTDEEKEQAAKIIGFPDAAVDRIVPLQKHEDKLLVVVEPFYEWVVNKKEMLGEIPAIDGVTYVDDLKPFIERKLYTVNTGHATAAYFGYLLKFDSIDKAILDPYVYEMTKKVLSETGALLVAKYNFDKEQHDAYITKILKRFKNSYITDEVTRVGRSPVRKLSPADRLVGPAVQAMEYDIQPTGLATVIAAALLFNYSGDPEAVEVQEYLQQNGLESTISKYTGIANDNPLFSLIVEQYKDLKANKLKA